MADFDEEKQRCFPLCFLDKCLHGMMVPLSIVHVTLLLLDVGSLKIMCKAL